MHGHSKTFFHHKEETSTYGEDNDQMMPATRETFVYISIALLSGCNKLYPLIIKNVSQIIIFCGNGGRVRGLRGRRGSSSLDWGRTDCRQEEW